MKTITALLLLLPALARADWISELGVAIKNSHVANYSDVLAPQCHLAVVTETRPYDPDIQGWPTHCGGDNPMFVGWLIAYERDIGKHEVFTIRTGFFHVSHWFDGGEEAEVHFTVPAFTTTINWSNLAKKRRGR